MLGQGFSENTTYVEFKGRSAFRIEIPLEVKLDLATEDTVFRFEDSLHIVLTRMCGKNLVDALFDPIKLLSDIGPVLKTIHRHGYTHGDIKLDNVVLCNDRYTLIDWAFLKQNKHTPKALTSTPSNRAHALFSKGTPEYMLPVLYVKNKTQFLQNSDPSMTKAAAKNLAVRNYQLWNVRLFNLPGFAFMLYSKRANKPLYKAEIYKKNDEFAVACMLVEWLRRHHFLFKMLPAPNGVIIELSSQVSDADRVRIKTLEGIISSLIRPQPYFETYEPIISAGARSRAGSSTRRINPNSKPKKPRTLVKS